MCLPSLPPASPQSLSFLLLPLRPFSRPYVASTDCPFDAGSPELAAEPPAGGTGPFLSPRAQHSASLSMTDRAAWVVVHQDVVLLCTTDHYQSSAQPVPSSLPSDTALQM